MAQAGAGTYFGLVGGVLTPFDLAAAATPAAPAKPKAKPPVLPPRPLFVQISDTHIGFNKESNPDVNGTLTETIQLINALPKQPALIIHTGDITHFGKPEEFETAQYLLSNLRVKELHTVPGEHDINDPVAIDYLQHFGRPSQNKGYYSFDHEGVHFVALINVLQSDKSSGFWKLGAEQLAWVEHDLKGRSDSTPIVVFTHIPLWMVYEPWSWGTADSDALLPLLRRFGSVTVLNGHIHQIVQKVEGNITFHTARSTAFPLPQPGSIAKPSPLTVPQSQLRRLLGLTNVTVKKHPLALELDDKTLA
jgi:3',5'-cyclic AMP phosphodiesterase CpdA